MVTETLDDLFNTIIDFIFRSCVFKNLVGWNAPRWHYLYSATIYTINVFTRFGDELM